MDKLLFEKYKTSEVTNTRRVINTPNSFTKKHLFYIQEAGYLKSLKPHLSTRTGLSSYLFLIVLSGSGQVAYQDGPVKIPEPSAVSSAMPEFVLAEPVLAKAGDCFFLDCSNRYTHISSGDDPWELLWIHFNGPQAAAYYACFRERFCWHFHSLRLAELTGSIWSIIEFHEERTDNTDLLTAQHIVNILTISATEADPMQAADSPLSEKLKTIARYLDEHYMEELTLDQLSEQFFISKYYLSREFKKEYGLTIIQYLLTKKITNAKELLRYSNSSIEEIARLCGIDDPSYFNKVFKKYEGHTASEYRKQW